MSTRSAVLSGVLVGGMAALGCGAPTQSSPSPGVAKPLVVKVTSVTAGVTPPTTEAGDLPAEQVDFIVYSATGPFSCTVRVFRSGAVVATATTQMAAPGGVVKAIPESVQIGGVRGGTFTGKPSDARVDCHIP